jgi:hypothetical protein
MDNDNTMKDFTSNPGSSSSAHTSSADLEEKKEAHHPVAKDEYQQEGKSTVGGVLILTNLTIAQS